MKMRPAHAVDAQFALRSTHHVDAPENYEDWRDYAFSDAPELIDDLDVMTPLTGVQTV